MDEERIDLDEVVAKKKLSNPHRVVKEILKDKRAERHYERGFIRTSEDNFMRSLNVYDIVLKSVETQDPSVEIKIHFKNIICRFGKDTVFLAIREKRSRSKSYTSRGVDYSFTGDLVFIIGETSYYQKKWHDNKSKKIEDYIDDIIASIFTEAEEIRKTRERHREASIRAEYERQERYRIQRSKDKEIERFDELLKAAQDYKKAKIIREFLDDMQSEFRCQNEEDTFEINSYIQWANQKADWLDPLIGKDDELLGKRHTKWVNDIISDNENVT